MQLAAVNTLMAEDAAESWGRSNDRLLTFLANQLLAFPV